MGSFHFEKFHSLPNCEVMGIYDIETSRATQVALNTGVKVFEKVEELLFEADSVVVASSSASHYPIVKQALNAGVHVLVEKPLALTSKEASELAKLAEQTQLVLQVGFVERFRMREMTKSLDFSSIKQIDCERVTERAGRELDVDVITDLMIHDLDLILSLGLGTVSSLSARGTSVLHRTTDIAVADLTFSSGTQVHLIANRLGPRSSRKMRILMENKYCKLDLGDSTTTLVTSDGSKTFTSAKEKDFLYEQAKSFCDSVLNQKAPIVSAQQGALSIELLERVLASVKSPTPSISSENPVTRDKW